MSLVVTGYGLTIHDVVDVARRGRVVQLAPEAAERIQRCRAMLEQKVAEKKIMYGTNTGIGEFSEIVLSDDQLKLFQKYLIANHAAGIGKPFAKNIVRAAMLSRINVHAKGHSAGRFEITQMLVEMLNRDVIPVVCEKGSVGACGDLAPMSQIALAMTGFGEVFYNGERLPAEQGLRKGGLQPIVLEARDGLAIINGSNVITGIGCLALYDAYVLLQQAEIAAAMSLEALKANMSPYDERIHKLRGFSGAVTCAANIRRCIAGSDLVSGKVKTKVQDAYSMRSTPQVIGAARDLYDYALKNVETELNGVCDNPIFIPDDDVVISGANFQGTPVSLPIDTFGAAMAMVCVLSERRLNRLLNPALSQELPAFLTKNPGFYSGLMLSQYTAGMLTVEQKILATPAFIHSVPAAADQEDFVSMGMNSALKTQQIIDIASGVLGIEFFAAAQALDLRGFSAGAGTMAAHKAIREVVSFIEDDRPLFPDHNAMKTLVESGGILKTVEGAIGKLH